MTDMEKEVELLFPNGKAVTVGGMEFTIKPFGFGKFPKVMKVLEGLMDTMPKGVTASDLNYTTLLDIVAANGDNAIELCCLATDQKREFFNDVQMDEAVVLLTAIIEVNKDFFVNRLLPKMTGAVESLSASLGAVSSPASSKTDTASKT